LGLPLLLASSAFGTVQDDAAALERCIAEHGGASSSKDQASAAMSQCFSTYVQNITRTLGLPQQPGAAHDGALTNAQVPTSGDARYGGAPKEVAQHQVGDVDESAVIDPGAFGRDSGGAPMPTAGSLDGAPGSFGASTPPPLPGSQAAAAAGLDAQFIFRARQALNAGDPVSALKLATFAVDTNPKKPDGYAMRAAVWNRDKRYLMAENDATQALAIAPDNVPALDERAYARNMTNRPALAKQDAEHAIRIDPKDAQAWLNLAIAQEAAGDAASAQKSYEMAARLDPSLRPLYEEFLRRSGLGRSSPLGIETSTSEGLPKPLVLGGALAALALALGGGFLVARAKGGGRSPFTTNSFSKTTGSRRKTTRPPAKGKTGGRLIGSNYEVTKELGRGGMGVVYEAVDQTLGRKVAIKQMRTEVGQSEREKNRFLTEARTVAKFQHPNIVGIYSVIEQDGKAFLVFEHVDGESLDHRLGRVHRLPPAEAAALFSGIGAALDYSHSHKVIHRDLKPSNIMITSDGVAKVMDFGIAHEAKLTVSKMTQAEAWGTMAYMPPEQEMGQTSREADVFAFGVLAYEALVGALPFPGPNFLAQKQRRAFVPPSSVPAAGLRPELDPVFRKVLDPEPGNRYHSAGDFAADLAAALSLRPA
jgi:tRNA A-37 threonylcarbamoyl transferase component Bud32